MIELKRKAVRTSERFSSVAHKQACLLPAVTLPWKVMSHIDFGGNTRSDLATNGLVVSTAPFRRASKLTRTRKKCGSFEGLSYMLSHYV